MKKFFTMAIALGMFTLGNAEELTILAAGEGEIGLDNPPLIGLGLSPSGKYATGAIDMGMGLWVGDVETGKVTFQFLLDADGYVTDEGGELRHVDNNGTAIGFTWTGLTYDMNGDSVFLPLDANCKSSLGEDITADGKLKIGSMIKGSTLAGYWIDDEWTYLPMPTDEEMASIELRQKYSAAKFVSCDGKYIYGCLGSFTIPCAWVRNDAGEYECDFWPLRFLKLTADDEEDASKPLYSISAMYGMCMSDNGRYMGALGLLKNANGNAWSCPVVYDTQLKTLTLYNAVQEIDLMGEGLWPTAICNDGSMIGCVGQPSFRSMGSFFLKAGEEQAKLFRDIFPEYNKVYGESDELGFAIPTCMSADGTKILGYTYYADDYNDVNTPAYYESFVIENEFCEESGVEEIATSENAVPETYYDINGRRIKGLQKGMNIVRMSDGSSRKVMK